MPNYTIRKEYIAKLLAYKDKVLIKVVSGLRRGCKVWTGTARNAEVDFVCKTPTGDIEYYQVAWEISHSNTVEREFGSLEKIPDNYPKYLLTTDSFTQDRSGIKHLNVFNWLLEL